MIIVNTAIYIFFIIFFTISILGHGLIFKKTFNLINSNLGETGLFGFVQLYFIVIILHFFFPINIYIGLFVLISGLVYFFFNFQNISINLSRNELVLILIIFLLISMSVNLHDDYRLYQLPYIKTVQEYKIIFGLVNINDFLGYTHGLYDIMSLFKLPYFKNRLIFTVPLIFVFFCIITFIDYFKNFKINKITEIFIFLILILFLLKFNRLKEYGTDVPVILLVFLVQVYFLELISNFRIDLFKKFLIFSLFAFFLKLYSILIFFYFLFFINKQKKIIIFFKTNIKLCIFLFLLTFLTFSKTLINTGCIIYPEPATCFDKKVVQWSFGKKATEYRKDFLTAGSKGWRQYLQSINFKDLIEPRDYLNKHKFSYIFYTLKDKDHERILTPVLIVLILIFFNLFNKSKKNKKNIIKNKNFLLWSSFSTFIFWLFLFPSAKYGGYSFVLFFFFIFFYVHFNKFFIKNYSSYKVIFFISLFFFSFKNLNRIYKEYLPNHEYTNDVNFSNKNFPLPNFRSIEYIKINNDIVNFNLSIDLFECSNINQICVPGVAKDSFKFYKTNNYIFVIAEEHKNLEKLKKWTDVTHFNKILTN